MQLTRYRALAARARQATADRSTGATNTRLLYWDGLWLGIVFGIAGNFTAVFATRLGASAWLLGALTSGPALINIFWQLLAARLVDRWPDRIRLTRRAAGLVFLGYLAISAVPLLMAVGWQPYAIVVVALAQALPVAVWNIGYTSLFPELVPRERMAGVVGTQTALMGVTTTASVMVAGALLTALPFPWGYQALFVLCFMSSLGSLVVWRRLIAPEHAPQHVAPVPAANVTTRVWRGPFARFTVGALLLNLGIFTAAPIFPLRWVDQLALGDSWISAFATLLSAGTIVGAYAARMLAARWPAARLLGVAGILLATYPAVAALVDIPLLIAGAAGVTGLLSGVINVTLFNALADVTPPDQRPRFVGLYGWLVNLAVFAGPVVGAGIVQLTGIEQALLGGALIRVIAGLFFLLVPFGLARRAGA